MKEENKLQEIPAVWVGDTRVHESKAADVLKSLDLADDDTILMVRQGLKDPESTSSQYQDDTSAEKSKLKPGSGS